MYFSNKKAPIKQEFNPSSIGERLLRKNKAGTIALASHSRSFFVGTSDEISNHYIEDIGVIAD